MEHKKEGKAILSPTQPDSYLLFGCSREHFVSIEGFSHHTFDGFSTFGPGRARKSESHGTEYNRNSIGHH